MKKTFKLKGMHCNSCSMLIEKSLNDKVKKVSASFVDEEVKVEFDEKNISEQEIIKEIEKLGYGILKEDVDIERKKLKKESFFSKYNTSNKIGFIFSVVLSCILLGVLIYLLFTYVKIPDLAFPSVGDQVGLGLLFIIGILTGFHCVSMCGGFVVSYTAKNAIKGHKSYKQHLAYGGAKVISYMIIGGLFGLIGGIVAFSINLRAGIAIFAGIFMIFYSLSLLGLKFFRKFQFNPKFLTKFTLKTSGKVEGNYKRPIITGLLNGLFIACGPLQAMYLYAAGTGSFISGAMALAAFGLGTLPVMIIFGTFASAISHKTTQKILKISAVVVLILGLIMLNRGLTLSGSNLSFDSIKNTLIPTSIVAGSTTTQSSENVKIVNGIQEVTMNVDASGYSPNSFVLTQGIPVKWNINVQQLTGCNNEIILNQYGIVKKLKTGLNVIEFTPDKEGTITFTCWMGMLRGSFIVTKSGTATQDQVKAATPPKGASCGCGGGSK